MTPKKRSPRKEVDGNRKAPGEIKSSNRKTQSGTEKGKKRLPSKPESSTRKSTAKGGTKTPSKLKSAVKKAPKKNVRRVQKSPKAKAVDYAALTPAERAGMIIIESYRLVNSGNYPSAMLLLSKFPVTAANQKQKATYCLLSAIAVSKGDEKKKINILNLGCEKDNNNPFLHCHLGIEYVRGGDIKNALRCLANAKKINPTLGQIKRLEKWIETFKPGEKVTRERLAKFKSLLDIGFALKKKGEYDMALKAYVQAGNVLINIDLVENLLSLLGELKDENLTKGRAYAKSGIKTLKHQDCLILESKFAKKGDPVIITFLKERIKSLE